MATIRSHFWRGLLKAAASGSLPAEALRKKVQARAARRRLPAGVKAEPVDDGVVRGEWLIPEEAAGRQCILYLRGGSYATGSVSSHRVMMAYIALASGCRVFAPNFRLSPEYGFPAARNDAQAAYRWLLVQGVDPKQIALAGDSAGGGLAFATALAIRDAGEPMPGLMFGLSPWIDPACSGESPLDADFAGLPPMLLHTGGDDILLSDAGRLAQRARAAGIDVRLRVWTGMWHVFQAFAPYVPEANDAINEIGSFVRGWRQRLRLQPAVPAGARRRRVAISEPNVGLLAGLA